MQEITVQPDRIAYNASMSACLRCEQWAPALELLTEMRAQSLQASFVMHTTLIGDSWYFYPYHRLFGRLARRPVVKKLWAPCKAPKNSVVGVEIPAANLNFVGRAGKKTTADLIIVLPKQGPRMRFGSFLFLLIFAVLAG